MANSPINLLVLSIKLKTANNNLIFTCADEGNTVIAMYKLVYVEKTVELLHNFEIGDTSLAGVHQKEI